MTGAAARSGTGPLARRFRPGGLAGDIPRRSPSRLLLPVPARTVSELFSNGQVQFRKRLGTPRRMGLTTLARSAEDSPEVSDDRSPASRPSTGPKSSPTYRRPAFLRPGGASLRGKRTDTRTDSAWTRVSRPVQQARAHGAGGDTLGRRQRRSPRLARRRQHGRRGFAEPCGLAAPEELAAPQRSGAAGPGRVPNYR